jgi:hypothetical protein
VSVPPATIRDQTRTWLTPLPKFLTSLTWFFAVHALGLAALMACGLLMTTDQVGSAATNLSTSIRF